MSNLIGGLYWREGCGWLGDWGGLSYYLIEPLRFRKKESKISNINFSYFIVQVVDESS